MNEYHRDDSYIQAVLMEAAGLESLAAQRRGFWAVVYGLVPVKDGDSWIVLLGDDLQSGIAGCGRSPSEAILDFDRAMEALEKTK